MAFPSVRVADVLAIFGILSVAGQEIRLRFDVATDLEMVRGSLTRALASVEGVDHDPAPDVVAADIIDGDVEVICRFWTASRRTEATAVRDRAISAILGRLHRSDVPLSSNEVHVRIAAHEQRRAP